MMGVFMNPILRKYINDICSILKDFEEICGIINYGSIARGEDDYYSDVDLFIYCQEDNNLSSFKMSICNAIVNYLKRIGEDILEVMEINNKIIIYTKENFIKFDLNIRSLSDCPNDVIYIIESNCSITNAILYDRDGVLLRVISENWVNLKNNLPKVFKEYCYKFLDYYNGFMVYYSRGDMYRAYMHYKLAYFKIAGLCAIVNGVCKNLYQPKRLTIDIIKDDELRRLLYDSSSTMEPLDLYARKEKMIELFKILVSKGDTIYNTNLTKTTNSFINAINKKYPPFYNFRDIALIPNLYGDISIDKGVVYRSSALYKYPESIVEGVLNRFNIKYILDLRTDEEIRNGNYSEDFIKKYKVVNIPITLLENKGDNYYVGLYENNREQFKKILDFVESVNDKSILIHCEHGVDRTGIATALILYSKGVDCNIIIEEYMHSVTFSKRSYIENLITYFKRKSNRMVEG